jgi:glyoxylase-like metal-dependent hydrolase (beta-lactamase superfamily II)
MLNLIERPPRAGADGNDHAPSLSRRQRSFRLVHERARLMRARHGTPPESRMPDIAYGVPVTVSPRVRRITAPNAGRMTGPGTNSYLVGEHELALIDPGPALPEHIDALARACGSRLRWIIVTHTHRDHSPAARPLADLTGAELVGNVLPNDGFQDETFSGARALAQDERLTTPEFTLRALLSPGHVANHVCYLIEEDRLLVTGDHVMGGSTVVIIPPAGNMRDYMASLERMLHYDIESIAPGHGDLIPEPAQEIRHLIAHRLKREAKVADALAALGPCALPVLTPRVYDDVDPGLHNWAALSLHAHLIKLLEDGRARLDGEIWTLIT